MTNNDILRRLGYALNLDNTALLAIFAEADVRLRLVRLAGLLKHDEEPGFEPLSDELLGRFLDGLVSQRRGKRELQPGEAPPAPLPMTNNRVLRSLKIALELKDTDMLAIMQLAETPISKGELSALFRREGHPNFQACGNQFLRNFLRGLGLWRRGSRPTP